MPTGWVAVAVAIGISSEAQGHPLVDLAVAVVRTRSRDASLAPGDVGAAVDAALSEIALLAERKQVRLAREGDAVTPAVRVNRGMLDQLLVNLLDDAVKFSPSGGLVTVRVEAADPAAVALPTSHAVRVTVADEGPGIPAESRERVFHRFFQVPRQGGTSGTGLGLHICRRIVESHGGRIEVLPTGKGLSFVLPAGD